MNKRLKKYFLESVNKLHENRIYQESGLVMQLDKFKKDKIRRQVEQVGHMKLDEKVYLTFVKGKYKVHSGGFVIFKNSNFEKIWDWILSYFKLDEDDSKLSPLQKQFRQFFFNTLDQYEVETPAELTDEQKSQFFNKIKDGWKEGEGVK